MVNSYIKFNFSPQTYFIYYDAPIVISDAMDPKKRSSQSFLSPVLVKNRQGFFICYYSITSR